jgi:hypothetical protein
MKTHMLKYESGMTQQSHADHMDPLSTKVSTNFADKRLSLVGIVCSRAKATDIMTLQNKSKSWVCSACHCNQQFSSRNLLRPYWTSSHQTQIFRYRDYSWYEKINSKLDTNLGNMLHAVTCYISLIYKSHLLYCQSLYNVNALV